MKVRYLLLFLLCLTLALLPACAIVNQAMAASSAAPLNSCDAFAEALRSTMPNLFGGVYYEGSTMQVLLTCDPASVDLPAVSEDLPLVFHQVEYPESLLHAVRESLNDYIISLGPDSGFNYMRLGMAENRVILSCDPDSSFDIAPVKQFVKEQFGTADMLLFVEEPHVTCIAGVELFS